MMTTTSNRASDNPLICGSHFEDFPRCTDVMLMQMRPIPTFLRPCRGESAIHKVATRAAKVPTKEVKDQKSASEELRHRRLTHMGRSEDLKLKGRYIVPTSIGRQTKKEDIVQRRAFGWCMASQSARFGGSACGRSCA